MGQRTCPSEPPVPHLSPAFLGLLPGFALYALASSITPGPNNLMLMASGANFGVRRTLPHAMGISLGFGLMVFVIGIGLGALFLASPVLQAGMKVLGFGYILWLAWKVANSSGIGEGDSAKGRPFTFIEAALFQWINIKAWMMGIGAVSLYTTPGGNILAEVLVLALIFVAVNQPSVALWMVLGAEIKRFLSTPGSLRLFNIVMAVLLVASVLPMLWV
jgi:threonine/homoserine/homoserine lactone efflux protein